MSVPAQLGDPHQVVQSNQLWHDPDGQVAQKALLWDTPLSCGLRQADGSGMMGGRHSGGSRSPRKQSLRQKTGGSPLLRVELTKASGAQDSHPKAPVGLPLPLQGKKKKDKGLKAESEEKERKERREGRIGRR